MNDVWVGSGCGSVAFWCDRTYWWYVVCTYVLVGIPTEVVYPAGAGFVFSLGRGVPYVGSGIPRHLFLKGLYDVVEVGECWKFASIGIGPIFH